MTLIPSLRRQRQTEFEANLVYRTVSEQPVLCRDPVKGKERNEDNSMNRTRKRGQMVERLFSMYQARVHPQQGTS